MTASPSGTLSLETEGPLATLTITSAGKRNAMSASMWRQFAPLLTELAADPTNSVLLVRGAGDNFSAGADISDLEEILTDDPDGGVMSEAENALAAFPKPTIAAIDGYCVGGGWEIAAACDLRICSDRSSFGITPSRLGIIYPRSAIERVVAIAGPAVAKHLLFTGELVDAHTAFTWGLVTKVLPAETFWESASEFVAMLAARSQFSIQAMKEIIADLGLNPERDDRLHRTVVRWLNTPSADREIGVDSFLHKSQPEFTWRRDG